MDIIYFKQNDESPVEDFLKKLPPKIRARFSNYLNHLAEQDGVMTGIAFRKLHGYPMEEIRIKQSHNLHRVIIHVQFESLIIVLHGFTKKEGESTPEKELKVAYERLLMIKPSLQS